MRLVFYIISIGLLILSYLAWGGQIHVLLQPIEFIGIFLICPILLSAKYGFKNTLTGFLKGEQSNDFISDGIFISNSLSVFMLVSGIIITIGKISQGKEIIGHSIGASLVSILYGIIQSAFILTISTKTEITNSKIKLNSSILSISAIGTLMFAFMIFWLLEIK